MTGLRSQYLWNAASEIATVLKPGREDDLDIQLWMSHDIIVFILKKTGNKQISSWRHHRGKKTSKKNISKMDKMIYPCGCDSDDVCDSLHDNIFIAPPIIFDCLPNQLSIILR